MKRKSASKKLLPLMLILMLILGISMPANAAVNPRLNSTKKVLYVGKTSQLKVVNWKKAVKWSSSNNWKKPRDRNRDQFSSRWGDF